MPLDVSACGDLPVVSSLTAPRPGSQVEGRSFVDRDEPTPGPWFSHVRDLAKRLWVDVRNMSNAQIIKAVWFASEPAVQRAWRARGFQR